MFKSGMKKLIEGALETRVPIPLSYHTPHHYRAVPSRVEAQNTVQDTPGPAQA